MIHEINHPLVKHKLTVLRDKGTSHKKFRELVDEITMFLAYEALSDMELRDIDIETPLVKTKGKELVNDIVIAPILRAGVGMLDGMLNMIPTARVGFVGLYRDPKTKMPVEYYQKMPTDLNNPYVMVVDPMLATGGSIIATIDMLKRKNFDKIKIITILCSPEGVQKVQDAYPEIDIYTASVDEYLDDHKYIIPGLGDAGDRLFGTK